MTTYLAWDTDDPDTRIVVNVDRIVQMRLVGTGDTPEERVTLRMSDGETLLLEGDTASRFIAWLGYEDDPVVYNL